MDLRSSPGEVLDRVARDGEVFVIERNGQPKACLVPVSFLLPDIAPQRIAKELAGLKERGENYRVTITDNRELEIGFHETVSGENVVLTVVLPHGYPNSAPRAFVAPLAPNTPHRWNDGSLSILGRFAAWNAKSHGVSHFLAWARRWLREYASWRKTGEWPRNGGNNA